MEWQPIKTAPKDGTWVLLTGFKKGGLKTVSHLYVVAGWFMVDERQPHMGARWFFADEYHSYVRDPTHWAHLPEVPAPEDER